MSTGCGRKLEHLGERVLFFLSFVSYFHFCCFSSAKSSHPKKTGTTKNTSTPTTTSTPRPRSKEAGAAAQSDGRDSTSKRKSDAPTSLVTQKVSTETPNQPGDPKSLPLSSDTKAASSKASGNAAEGAQSDPNTPAAGEDTQTGVAPEPTVQSPHVNTATEDTSFTEGETESRSQVDKRERTRGEGGQEEKDKTESAVHNSPRYLLRMC